ncbi:DNA methyltransferase [Rhodococcus sp. UFZ-B548]|uniref:class I SAM-dependent DNA methyltransferase n=1 Tax=Rhodococcus sp. UFZ-B548 TaxID=2742212 RepID=UPI0015F47CC7|nr:DNA methyltransferase [Rhodococcus sp. UFZ-B548]
MRTHDETRDALNEFVATWRNYQGTEKAGAQTFLNQLIEAYTGEPDAMKLGAEFERHTARDASRGFMDLYWDGVCIIEMKSPSETIRLAEHRPQLLDYWRNSANSDQPAPRFTILCSFQKFEVWEPGRYPNAPVDEFRIEELPGFMDSLSFLTGRGSDPVYGGPGKKVTLAASERMIDLYNRLSKQVLRDGKISEDDLRRFIVQCTWAMFAEDLGLIPDHRFTSLLKALQEDARTLKQRSAGKEVQNFLTAMNFKNDLERSEGILAGLPYVNGGLLESVAYIPLHLLDITDLRDAAGEDWSYVNPTIFGSLFEGCLGDRRRMFGAHYTHEQDIMQIVEPTILRPWRERIDGATKTLQAEKILSELCQFKVLDPACGSGNFLYVAYREIRRLEEYAKERIDELRKNSGKADQLSYAFYPVDNLYGIEVDPFAVQIARLTIWMGHAQMARELRVVGDDPLPLHNLHKIVEADALDADWPPVDAIIGNPPFIGASRIRVTNGDPYLTFLTDKFNCGIVDMCVYWIRKAHENLADGARAGLVGTNSIRQNKSRVAGLDHIIGQGAVITDAISSQVWSGDAAVHVSIVNWVKNPKKKPVNFLLDKVEVPGITAFLKEGSGVRTALPLKENLGIGFEGCKPAGSGFILDDREASDLLARNDADYSKVIKRYLISKDIANDPHHEPTRWIIDFGTMELEDAMAFPAALDIVRRRVKPDRDTHTAKNLRERWWRFDRPRPEMRTAIGGLNRFASVGRHGKRLLFTWSDLGWCPSDATNVIARDDDWTFGVLTSVVHDAWAWTLSSTLKSDLRYTPKSALWTFPFPDPKSKHRKAIEQAARDVVTERRKACDKLIEQGKKLSGLTAIYNLMDEGGFAALKDAHIRLDHAVCLAYGWEPGVAYDREAIVTELYGLNMRIASGKLRYEPFGET